MRRLWQFENPEKNFSLEPTAFHQTIRVPRSLPGDSSAAGVLAFQKPLTQKLIEKPLACVSRPLGSPTRRKSNRLRRDPRSPADLRHPLQLTRCLDGLELKDTGFRPYIILAISSGL
jgi:hypothetical protein